MLYDVAIIDENNIWAVGEIYLRDSLGNCDPNRYNAVIWNGNNWNIIRIPYNYQGMPFYHPIQSVYAFGPNDIWFCGNGVVHWDGNNFHPISIPSNVWGSYQMNKLWGSSSEDLYVVGNNGNIAHWDGVRWRKIESGTTLNIYDIYSDNGEIICIASGKFISSGKKVLSIRYGSTSEINSVGLSDNLSSIWFKSQKKYYIAGAGIYWSKSLKYANWEK